MRHTTLFTAFALISSTALAQEPILTWGSDLDVSPSGQGLLRPRVAVNADLDPVVLWGRTGPEMNLVAVGTGSTFTAPVMPHPMGVVPTAADWQGSEIASDGSKLWVVLKATPEMDMPIYAVRSDNGGYTWGDTLRIDAGNGNWSRFPNIATGPASGPVVEYMRFDSGFVAPRHAVSRMSGGVFQPAVDVSSPFAPHEVCDCCPGGVAAQGENVVALYRNNGFNIRTIWAASSGDGGTSFGYGAEVDPTNWMINACPSSGPDGYVTGDSTRFVWMSAASMGAKVYIGSAHLPELVTGIGRRLTANTSTTLENFPPIAGNGDTLGVVWQSTTSGNNNIMFAWGVYGAAALSQPMVVNTNTVGQQGTPDIAYANGAFHIVWSDHNADVVRYRKATITSTIGIPEVQVEAPRVWPSPATDLMYFTNPDPRCSSLRLCDASGRTVIITSSDRNSLDVRTLEPGSYQLSFLASDGAVLFTQPVLIGGGR